MRYEDSVIFEANFGFKCNTNDSMYIFSEFAHGVYNIEEDDFKNKSIIDIGANIGLFSLSAIDMGAKRVISIEANPNTFPILEENISIYKNKKHTNCIIELYDKAITGDGHRVELFDSHPTSGGCRVSECASGRESIDFNKFLDSIDIKEFGEYILKSDCESSEYDLFSNITDYNIKKFCSLFSKIFIELHQSDDNDKKHFILRDMFLAMGYSIKSNTTGRDYKFIKTNDCDIAKTLELQSKLKKTLVKIKFSIIIPTFDNLKYLKICIESIFKYTDMSDKEVIVISNGCKDDTYEWLRDNAYRLEYEIYDIPLGYPKAVNHGIKKSKGDFIVFINNDLELLEQHKDSWINEMYSPIGDKIKITGPGIYRCNTNEKKQYEIFIPFFCAMMPKSIFYEIGFLDESFTPGYGEDIDFCFRTIDAGYEVKHTPNINIKHDGDSPSMSRVINKSIGHDAAWEKVKLKYLTDYQFKLAILIPTMKSNSRAFFHLKCNLEYQIDKYGGAYYIINDDEYSSIGFKRQALLNTVNNAEYVVFVDDDDTLPVDYLPKIYKAMESKPDVIVGKYLSMNEEENSYCVWDIRNQRHIYREPKLYVNPIGQWAPRRTSLAKLTTWPDMSAVEDYLWDLLQMKHYGTIKYIDDIIYIYDHRIDSASQKRMIDNKKSDAIFWNLMLDCGIIEENRFITDTHLKECLQEYKSLNLDGQYYPQWMVEKWKPIVDQDSVPEWRKKLGYNK